MKTTKKKVPQKKIFYNKVLTGERRKFTGEKSASECHCASNFFLEFHLI